MLRNFKNYILEDDFRINYIKNKIDVVNYECIEQFNDNKVVIKYIDGNVIILGKDLIISKLLNNEVLVSGTIKGLEFK